MSRAGDPTDDDPAADWVDAEKTTLDEDLIEAIPAAASEPVTAPHDVQQLPGYEVGRRAGREEKARVCYEEGQEDVKAALRSVLLERGLTNEETAHLVLAVWERRTLL